MPLRIDVLGTPQIEVDGEPLRVDTRKAVALLAYLAVRAGPQSRDLLVDLLWPDADPDRARAALRRTLSTLRSALGQRWVTVSRTAVGLDAEPDAVDVGRFRGLVAGAGDGPGAIARSPPPWRSTATTCSPASGSATASASTTGSATPPESCERSSSAPSTGSCRRSRRPDRRMPRSRMPAGGWRSTRSRSRPTER